MSKQQRSKFDCPRCGGSGEYLEGFGVSSRCRPCAGTGKVTQKDWDAWWDLVEKRSAEVKAERGLNILSRTTEWMRLTALQLDQLSDQAFEEYSSPDGTIGDDDIHHAKVSLTVARVMELVQKLNRAANQIEDAQTLLKAAAP